MRRAGNRRVREATLVAVALAVGSVLLLSDLPRPSSGSPVLETVWPAAEVSHLPGYLPDGSAYQPLLVLDSVTSIGSTQSPDGQWLRLVRRSGDELTELRALRTEARPRFLAVTPVAADGGLVWAESTAEPDGAVVQIWRAPPGGAPGLLTAETGRPGFFHSQHDLVIAEDRVHWVASRPVRGTELRSVPLTGGDVQVRDMSGDWALTRWPWLVSVPGAAGGQLLRRGTGGEPVPVVAEPGELVTCAVEWCRVLVPASAAESTRIELRPPAGGDSRLVAGGGQVSSPLVEVALLDRYEVWTAPGTEGGPVSNQQLFLYDLRRDGSVQIAGGVGRVEYRHGFLWWSTGGQETLRWHVLDLRTLT